MRMNWSQGIWLHLWFSTTLAVVLLQSWSALFNSTVRFEEWGAVRFITSISACLCAVVGRRVAWHWPWVLSLSHRGDPAAKGDSPMAFFCQLIPVCSVRAAPSKQLTHLSKNCQVPEPVTDFLVHNRTLGFNIFKEGGRTWMMDSGYASTVSCITY